MAPSAGRSRNERRLGSHMASLQGDRKMIVALTRPVPASIAHCELTHLARQPIDLARARAQHAAYERALELAGCTIERLPAEDGMADSVFVEDAAIVVDELA